MLTQTQIEKNWEVFRNQINEQFPERAPAINKFYDDFADVIALAPAASTDHHHNAFTGGYVDHVLRVMEFSKMEYYVWQRQGLNTENFTLSELLFAAAHHDLGKMNTLFDGLGPHYVPNQSNWHRENLGKMYSYNEDRQFALVPDLSLFILQKYGVELSWNEYLGIRIHDGVYDRANEAYYFSSQLNTKLRTNLPYILHAADFKAARYEFERWAKHTKKFKM